MIDPRLSKLARVIVLYSLGVKKDERVIINSPVVAAPLVREIYRETLKVGALPMIIAEIEGLEEIFYQEAQDFQLDDVEPIQEFMLDKISGYVNILAFYNTRRLSGVPSERIARRRKATAKIASIFRQKIAKGEIRGNIAPFPTQAMAQEASMGLFDFTEFVFSSLCLNEPDPIAEWERIDKEQTAICEYLDKKSELRFIGDKTDLTMSVKGRKWINCSGKYNLPDGEVFTAPIEDSVNGTIRFSLPGIYAGKEIEDIQLTFKNGNLVEAKASKGNDLLNKLIEVPGANILGEVAIGTNFGIDRFIKNMLFDEKMGGYVHLALGAAFLETGGTNESGVHWDMLKDMREPNSYIEADGEKFYEEGKFIIL